jgi:hypothetical protein
LKRFTFSPFLCIITTVSFLVTFIGLVEPALSGPDPVFQTPGVPSEYVFGQSKELKDLFHSVGHQYQIPEEVLEALGWIESRWNAGDGKPSTDWAYGMMGLRSSEEFQTLDRAAWIAKLEPDEIKTDAKSNLIAAAALLRSIADELHIANDSLEDWAPVITAYHGFSDPKIISSDMKFFYGAMNGFARRGFPDQSIWGIEPKVVSVDKAVSLVVHYSEQINAQPLVPTGFKATFRGKDLVLTWNKSSSSNWVGYNLYWEGGGSQETYAIGDSDYVEKNKRLTPKLITEPPLVLKNVDPNKEYSFYLMAVGSMGRVSRTQTLRVKPFDLKNESSLE